MKKQILFCGLLLISAIAAFANKNNKEIVIKKWDATNTYQSITITADVDVLLIEDTSSTINIEGETKAVEAVTFSVKNGELIVSSNGKLKGRAVVYIPVQQLQRLIIKANSEVTSVGLLNSTNLQVFIASDCQLRLFAKGKIKIDSDETHSYDYDLRDQFSLSESFL